MNVQPAACRRSTLRTVAGKGNHTALPPTSSVLAMQTCIVETAQAQKLEQRSSTATGGTGGSRPGPGSAPHPPTARHGRRHRLRHAGP